MWKKVLWENEVKIESELEQMKINNTHDPENTVHMVRHGSGSIMLLGIPSAGQSWWEDGRS